MILEGEIKDAKMSSFSSDFQTLIKHWFPLYFLYELLMSLRSCESKLGPEHQSVKSSWLCMAIFTSVEIFAALGC